MVEVLNSLADGWLAFQWGMFWQVGVLIAIIWIVDVSIHKWVWPQVRYALWLLVLVKLVVPPTLSSPASVTQHIPAAAEKVVSVRLNEAPAPVNEAPASGGTGVSPVTIPPVSEVDSGTQASSPRDDTAGWHGQAPLGRGVSEQEFPSLQQPNNSPPAKGKSGVAGSGCLSWKVYAMFVWLAGVVVLTTWLAVRLRGLRIQHIPSNCHSGVDPASRQYRPGPRLDGRGDSAQFEALLKAAAAKLRLKRLPEVIVTDRVACPAVFGVLRPVLLIPAAKLEHLDSRDMEHILLHELAHIKRGDLLVHAVYMVLQIAYWFNPQLWMIRKTLQNLRELCCDATVARLLKDDTVHYRQTLLETARGLLAQPVDPGLGLLGLFENSSWLVTRLQWLEKKTWKNRPLRIATVMVLVSVMAVCVLPMANRKAQADFFMDTTQGYIRCNATVDELSRMLIDMAHTYGFHQAYAKGTTSEASGPEYLTVHYTVPDNRKLTIEAVSEARQPLSIRFTLENGADYSREEIMIELARRLGMMTAAPPLAAAGDAVKPSLQWTMRPVRKTDLESFWGGWKNLPFQISQAEEQAVRTCAKISYAWYSPEAVRSEDVRQQLEAVLAQQPGLFYAEYLLGMWHRSYGNQRTGRQLLQKAFEHAPVILVQKYENAQGKPLAGLKIQTYDVECSRVKDGSLDPSLQLKYRDLVTDDEGCIYVPVYDTVYRLAGASLPDGYNLDYPTLGWFKAGSKRALMPAAVSHPAARVEDGFLRAAVPVQKAWMADIKDQDVQVFSFVHGEVLRFPNLADENALLRIPEGDLFCNYDSKQQKPKVTFLRSARLGGSGQGGSSLAFTVIPMKMPYVNTVTTAEGLVFEIRIVAGNEEVCLIEYRPMNETAGQALSKQKGIDVTGVVADEATGRPIARAVVCDDGYDGGKRRTFTDDAGRFVLRTAREEHTIAAKAKGYDWQRKTLKTWPFANHQKFDFNLSPLPAGVQEAVLLPEHNISKMVLSLKTGQFVPEQQAEEAREPYLRYGFTFPAGANPRRYTVHTVPDDCLGVEAPNMDLVGGEWGKDYEAAQGMWLAQSVGQLPDFKMSRMTRKVSRETMSTSDSFFINRHANTDWPYITAFRGDDGTHGVFEITKVQDRKIYVRFRTIDSVTSDQSPVTSEEAKAVGKIIADIGQAGTITAEHGSSVFGNTLRYAPVLYRGRAKSQADILLADTDVILNQFNTPIIKVKFPLNSGTVSKDTIGWVLLMETSFANQFVPNETEAQGQSSVTHDAQHTPTNQSAANSDQSTVTRAEQKSQAGSQKAEEKTEAESTSDPVNENSELKTKNSSFTATLSNGATVELLGISEHPSEGKPWWSPDGVALDRAPYPKMETAHTTAGWGRRAYEAAVKINGVDDFGYRNRISDSNGGGSCSTDEPGVHALSFSQPKNATEVQIEIGVAAGAWRTVSTQKADYSGVISGENLIWHGPVEQNGRTVLTMAHNLLDRDSRVIAIGTDGKEHTGGSTSATQGDMQSMQTRFKLPLSQIKSFRLQSRLYEWVTFKNVALRPGVKTNVQVEIEKSEDRSQKAEAASKVTSGFDPGTSDSGKSLEDIALQDWLVPGQDGMQVLLHSPRVEQRDGRFILFFKTDLISATERMLPHYGAPISEFFVQYDGQWYEMANRTSMLAASVNPSLGTERRNLHTMIIPSMWKSIINGLSMPRITPGRHTVAVGFPLSGDRSGPRDFVPSNTVEVFVDEPVTGEQKEKMEDGSQKAEQLPADSEQSTDGEQANPHKVTLANGVTVELLGVSEYPNEGKRWWSPNGQSPEISIEPYTSNVPSASPIKEDEQARLFALNFVNNAAADTRFKVRIAQAKYLFREPSRGRILVKLPKSQTHCDLNLSVAAGPWKAVAWGGTGKDLDNSAYTNENITNKDVIFYPLEVRNGKVVSRIVNQLGHMDCRAVMYDLQGKLHVPATWNNSGGSDVWSCESVFEIARDRIQRIEFQARPYTPVTFKNVSLRPGAETDVRVETEATDEPLAVSSVQSPVASEGQKTEAASASGSMKSQPAGIQYIFNDGRWVVDKESAAKLEFRVAPKKSELPEGELKSLEIELKEKWPYVENRLWVWRLADPSFDTISEHELAVTEHLGRTYVLLMNVPNMQMLADGSWGTESAAVVQDAQGRPAVEVTFDEAGGALFYELTQKSIGQRLAILINDKVVSAPKVQSAIRDRAIIAGTFTKERARHLASSLERGMLSSGPVDLAPAKFEMVYNKERGVYYLVVQIRNDGEGVLPKHRIRYYRGKPAEGLDETGHPHTGRHEAGPIEPGGEWNERTRDFHLPDGEYDFAVVLDYDQAVEETNEDNNAATLKVQIQDGRIVEPSPETGDGNDANAGMPPKILQFPEADTLNLLFTADSDDERKWWWPMRDPQGTAWPARGRIAVEDTGPLGLIVFVNKNSSGDPLSALDGLAADDLHTLVIHGTIRRQDEPMVIDHNIQSCLRLSGLKCLILNEVSVTEEAIAGLSQMQNLERLCVISGDLEDEHVAQIATMKNLRGLRVHGNLGNASAESIAGLDNLEELFASGMYLSNDSLYAISQMKKLRELVLPKALHTEDGLQYLAAMPSLQTLDMLSFELSPQGVEYIASIPNLQVLRINRPISDAAAEKLSGMRAIRELTLSIGMQQTDELTDAALHSLSQMKTLESLSVFYGQFTDDGFKQLAQLSRLKHVMIPNCTIGEDVYQYLMTTLPELKEAYFRNFPDLRDPRYKIPLPLHLLPTLERAQQDGRFQ